MDVSKLDKMKVVDLRSELQSRGLDTKGVKAVLIERLRRFLEIKSEAEAAAANSTNLSRRGRRTRSMTRSPSPANMKQPEPVLEPLQEENCNENAEDNQTHASTDEHLPKEDNEIQEEPEEMSAQEEESSQHSKQETYELSSEDSESEEQQEKEPELPENNANNSKLEEEEVVDASPATRELNKTDIPVTNAVKNETGKSENTTEKSENITEKSENITEKSENITEKSENESEKSENVTEKAETVDEIDADITMTTEKDDSLKEDAVDQCSKDEKEEKATEEHKKSRSRSLDRRDRSRSRHRSRSESCSGAEQSRDYTKSGFSAEDMQNVAEDEPLMEENQFGLSWFDSDIHLNIDPITFNSAKQLTHDVFALVWSGARTNFGVREGKVCFEVRLSEENPLSSTHRFRTELHLRGFRVGFSRANSTNLQLGESELSFAYCETGCKATNSEFIDYGKPFALDDVICCYLDLDSSPCTIKYTLNGEDLGVAFEFDKNVLSEEEALFPHVLCKGYEFQVNFADNENLLGNKERPTRRRLKKKEEEAKPEEDIKTETVTEQETKVEDTEKEKVEEKAIEEAIEKKEEIFEEAANGADNTEESAEGSAKVEEANVVVEKTEMETEKSVENDEDDPSPNKRQKMDDEKTNKSEADSIHSAEKSKRVVEEVEEYEDVLPEARDAVVLLPDFELIALIPEEKYVAGPQKPESRKDCEVIILIGLPGAGKTYWTLQHVQNHLEKRYDVIGADALIAKMTVDGQPRKNVHKGSWDTLYESCINSLSLLEEIAVKRRRNFILDQTNVYASVQRRKMKGFSNFKRTAVVCLPNEEELKRRITEKSEKGAVYTLRGGTLANLQANFSLPSLEFSWFDEILYTDLNGDEAKEEVKKINEKGKKSLDATRDKNRNRNRDYQKRDDRRRYDDRRRDYRSDQPAAFHRRNAYPIGGGGGGMGNAHNGSRWGPMGGGGGNGMMGNYHRSGGGGGGGGGWREPDRNYGGGGGGGGGNMRGYGGNRQTQRYYGGQQQNQGNWMQNNRNRYDDRFNRSAGVGGAGGSGSSGSVGGGAVGNRFDSYGGGNGGNGREFRDRDRDRNGGGGGGAPRRDNYRNMGGSGGHQQRDFRLGHRDNRVEDSRGGYDRVACAAPNSSNYNNPAEAPTAGAPAYDQFKNGGAPAKCGKWNSYNQYENQPQQQQAYYQQQRGNSWQQQAIENNQYQQQQQQYWNYNMQAYGQPGAEQQQQQQQQQQQWTEQQQREWMAWWQQQQGGGSSTTGNNASQHWPSYMHTNQQAATGSSAANDASSMKDAGSTSKNK